MSKDRFRGHYYSQLNHQRLSLSAVNMPAAEAGALHKMAVLFGLSRQNFGFNDGRLSVSGQPMKVSDVARWLAGNTPGLSVARAEKAVISLCEDWQEIEIKKRSKIVYMSLLASEQRDAPSASAQRKRKSRAAKQMERAVLSLYKENGKVLEPDVVLYRVQAAADVGSDVAERLMKQLIADGVLVPADGRFLISVSSSAVAPSALPPPPVSEGPSGRDGEGDLSHPDGCDMSQSLDHVKSQERDANASHDHDARADTRAYEESPERTGVRPGPGLRDGFAVEGGGGSAEGQQQVAAPSFYSGAYGSDCADSVQVRVGSSAAIWSASPDRLVYTAIRILAPRDASTSRRLLSKRLDDLCNYCGQYTSGGFDRAYTQFRQLVQDVNSESVRNGGKLRTPETELWNRLGEAMGIPRKKKQKADARR